MDTHSTPLPPVTQDPACEGVQECMSRQGMPDARAHSSVWVEVICRMVTDQRFSSKQLSTEISQARECKYDGKAVDFVDLACLHMCACCSLGSIKLAAEARCNRAAPWKHKSAQ